MKRYDLGDQPTLTITVRDEDGDPVDDASITLTVRSPTDHRDEGETHAVGDLGHPSTGVYTFDLALPERGLWVYRWQTTGSVILAEEREIYVKPALVEVP